MTQRRKANGQGSVTYNEKRKRYEYRKSIRQADGTYKRLTVTATTQAALDDKIDAVAKVAATPGLSPSPTAHQFLDYWVTDVLPLRNIQRSTRENYETTVATYIKPGIPADIALDRLTPAHVRQMLTRLRTQGKKGNTQKLSRTVLRLALRTAQQDGLVTQNVAALTDGVRVDDAKEGRTMTPEQAHTLLAHVRGHELEVPIMVMLSLGLRRSEMVALTWADVANLNTGETVRLRINKGLRKPTVGPVYMANTKTKSSVRTLVVPSTVADALRRHRIRQTERRLACGEGWGDDLPEHDFIFTDDIGNPIRADKFNRQVNALTKACGLGKWNSHEFRHTAASLMIAQDVDLKIIQETLGHSSIKITADVYGHLMEPSRQVAADAMEHVLWGLPATG